MNTQTAVSRENQQFLNQNVTVSERYGAEVEVRCYQLNISLYKMAFCLADVNI